MAFLKDRQFKKLAPEPPLKRRFRLRNTAQNQPIGLVRYDTLSATPCREQASADWTDVGQLAILADWICIEARVEASTSPGVEDTGNR